MKRAIPGVVLAIALSFAALACAAPAGAQQRVPAEKAAAAARNIATANEAMTRATALVEGLSGDNAAIQRATTLEQLLAIVDGRAPRIAAARAEIQQMQRQLAGLPPVAEPNGPVSLLFSDETVDNIEQFLLQVDGVLADTEDLGAAILVQDKPRMKAAVAALSGGAVVMLEYQGTSIRSGLALMDRDDPDYGIYTATACYYDAAAAYYRGALGLGSRTEAAAGVDAARRCIVDGRVAAQTAFEREQAHPPSNARERAFRARLFPITQSRLEVVADSVVAMETLRIHLLDPDGGMPGPTQQAALTIIEQRNMAIQAQEDAIYADQ